MACLLCICACIHICVYRFSACTCAHVWRPKTNVENLLQFLSTWIFKIGCLSKPGAHPFNGWAGQKTPGLNYFPRPNPTLQLQTHIMALDFLHGCWESELGFSCLHGKQITNEVISAILTYFFQTNKRMPFCLSVSSVSVFFPLKGSCALVCVHTYACVCIHTHGCVHTCAYTNTLIKALFLTLSNV